MTWIGIGAQRQVEEEISEAREGDSCSQGLRAFLSRTDSFETDVSARRCRLLSSYPVMKLLGRATISSQLVLGRTLITRNVGSSRLVLNTQTNIR